jgi:hypothetical protein
VKLVTTIDGWPISVGEDAVCVQGPDLGSLILFQSGRIMSGGCDVPGHVVQAMRVELAKLGRPDGEPRFDPVVLPPGSNQTH